MSQYLRARWVLVLLLSISAVARAAVPTYETLVADGKRLEKLERWSASGDAYLHAVYLRPNAPDAERLTLRAIKMHSSFNNLGCFGNKAGKGTDPIPIEGQLAKLLDAYSMYLALFSSSKMALTIRFRKAFALEGCNHFPEAADLYQQVYERTQDRELAGYARAGYRRVHRIDESPPGERDSRGEQRKAGAQ